MSFVLLLAINALQELERPAAGELSRWLATCSSDATGASRRRHLTEPRVAALAADRRSCSAFLALFLVAAAGAGLRRGVREGLRRLLPPRSATRMRWPRCKLTLLAAAIAVPANLRLRRLRPAGRSRKFDFAGKNLLTTLIDLPFAVSPVISGMVFVLLFGRQGLLGPVDRRARHQDRVRRAGHRAGDDLRVVSVRGARDHPGHGSHRHRGRRGGAGARRQRAADVLPRHAAEHQVGAALRRDPVQRARDGRVRRRIGRVRPDPRPDQHAAAARRDSLQRVHVPGGVRGGVAARVAGARHPGAEDDRRARACVRERRRVAHATELEA